MLKLGSRYDPTKTGLNKSLNKLLEACSPTRRTQKHKAWIAKVLFTLNLKINALQAYVFTVPITHQTWLLLPSKESHPIMEYTLCSIKDLRAVYTTEENTYINPRGKEDGIHIHERWYSPSQMQINSKTCYQSTSKNKIFVYQA